MSSKWVHHSYPNEYRSSFTHVNCDNKWERQVYPEVCKKEDQYKEERKKGVYAAQHVQVGDKTVIAGGILYDEQDTVHLKF